MFRYQVLMALYMVILLINQTINQSTAQTMSSSTGPSSYAVPIISRIAGCIDQADHTVDCARPARLTMYGSNFFSGLQGQTTPTNYLFIQVDTGTRQISMTPRHDINSSDTYLEFDVVNYGYLILPQQQLYNVTITNQRTKLASPPLAGFSLRLDAVPTVNSVTGCASSSSDGKTALMFDLVNDRMTISGSGFKSINTESATLRLGTSSLEYNPLYDNSLFLVFNDTTIVLSFTSKYLLLSLDAQNGVPQPLTLTQIWTWSTSPVWIQFTSLPQPVIESIAFDGATQGCELDNSMETPLFRDCVAGISLVYVQGKFLLKDSKFFVGGIEAMLVSVSVENIAELTMPVYQFTEGVFYGLTVVTTSGTTTWPPAFEFNTDPVITSVTPCVAPLRGSRIASTSPHCMPGEKFQISVLNVKQPISPRVLFAIGTNTSFLVECQDAVMVNHTSLFCTMPENPSTLNYIGLTVEWASGEKTQSLVLSPVWDPIGSPRITAVSGCFSNSGDPIHVNQCVGSSTTGVVLTLSGTNLAGDWILEINSVARPLANIFVVNNQTLICSLPPLRDFSLPLDIMYPITISSRLVRSNAVYLTFVEHEMRDPIDARSSIVLVIVVATICSSVGAIVICIVAVLLNRRVFKTWRRPSEFVSDFSTGNHVELSEIAEV